MYSSKNKALSALEKVRRYIIEMQKIEDKEARLVYEVKMISLVDELIEELEND